uniref:EB domain-containing protein n=1 Tax=Angiostrongylus cantonensis TaxID=6313 RepID=A0A158P859_ANGCA
IDSSRSFFYFYSTKKTDPFHIFVAADCPPGLTLLLSTNQRPVTCSPQDLCSCDNETPGSICQYSQGQNSYFCCTGEAPRRLSCHSTSCFRSISGHSVCSSRQCLDGQELIDGRCIDTVPIGSYCRQTKMCQGGSECVVGVNCHRRKKSVNVQVLVNGQCEPLAPPGTRCLAEEQCIDNSLCSSNTCQCAMGLKLINGYCIRRRGERCPRTQTWINNQCVSYSTVGGKCIGNGQCVGGSICNSRGICSCDDGFFEMDLYCIADNSSSPCSSAQVELLERLPTIIKGYKKRVFFKAQQLEIVRSKVVRAPAQFPFVSYSCNRRPWWWCVSGMETSKKPSFYDPLMFSSCDCIWLTGTTNTSTFLIGGRHRVLVNGQCLEKVPLGSRCSYTPQCLGNSRCTNGFCQCLRGSSETKATCSSPECGRNQVFVNRKCVPMVSVGDRCLFTEQCTGNSQCLNGFCECANGAASFDGICDITSSFCKSYQRKWLLNMECLISFLRRNF